MGKLIHLTQNQSFTKPVNCVGRLQDSTIVHFPFKTMTLFPFFSSELTLRWKGSLPCFGSDRCLQLTRAINCEGPRNRDVILWVWSSRGTDHSWRGPRSSQEANDTHTHTQHNSHLAATPTTFRHTHSHKLDQSALWRTWKKENSSAQQQFILPSLLMKWDRNVA